MIAVRSPRFPLPSAPVRTIGDPTGRVLFHAFEFLMRKSYPFSPSVFQMSPFLCCTQSLSGGTLPPFGSQYVAFFYQAGFLVFLISVHSVSRRNRPPRRPLVRSPEPSCRTLSSLFSANSLFSCTVFFLSLQILPGSHLFITPLLIPFSQLLPPAEWPP